MDTFSNRSSADSSNEGGFRDKEALRLLLYDHTGIFPPKKYKFPQKNIGYSIISLVGRSQKKTKEGEKKATVGYVWTILVWLDIDNNDDGMQNCDFSSPAEISHGIPEGRK